MFLTVHPTPSPATAPERGLLDKPRNLRKMISQE
jgi:hypothetical protein